MDYNIYIHDKTSGSSKPTQPKVGGSENTTPKSDNAEQEAGEASLETAATTTAGKVILAIYVAGKIAKGVINTLIPFITRETGDFRQSTAWNNQQAVIRNSLNPIGYMMGEVRFYQEARIYNQRQEQERLLVGDSFINNISRKS